MINNFKYKKTPTNLVRYFALLNQ